MIFIRNSLKFELKFNKLKDFSQESIKIILNYMEVALKFINIDITGSTNELFLDEDFLYYLKM